MSMKWTLNAPGIAQNTRTDREWGWGKLDHVGSYVTATSNMLPLLQLSVYRLPIFYFY